MPVTLAFSASLSGSFAARQVHQVLQNEEELRGWRVRGWAQPRHQSGVAQVSLSALRRGPGSVTGATGTGSAPRLASLLVRPNPETEPLNQSVPGKTCTQGSQAGGRGPDLSMPTQGLIPALHGPPSLERHQMWPWRLQTQLHPCTFVPGTKVPEHLQIKVRESKLSPDGTPSQHPRSLKGLLSLYFPESREERPCEELCWPEGTPRKPAWSWHSAYGDTYHPEDGMRAAAPLVHFCDPVMPVLWGKGAD